MMLPTTELRWFFRGAVPDEMARWIRRGDSWAQQPERVDQYLALPGCSSAGVKLREGRFEVKVQTAAPEPVRYPNDVRGHRDSWVKWSREVGNVGVDEDFWSADGERWIAVRKRRVLRGYALGTPGGDAAPHEVRVDGERPGRGCGVEITEVVVGADEDEERWWTLGLEGFDDGGSPTDALERVARMLFDRDPPPLRLTVDESLSYAAWLAQR